jgi:hypothetical protein
MQNNSCCSNINCEQESAPAGNPRKLLIGWFDYVKMFLNWLLLFRKNPYTVTPGLYFTGNEYDRNAPILVTCNFLSTVLMLQRKLKGLSVRLLVIDTNGINVWCSASKGKFSSEEILDKLNMYDKSILSDSGQIQIILPKLSLSGVRLAKLRENKIKPVIGPVYAKNLKQYLQHPPYKDCSADTVHFGFAARAYTVVPTAVQFSKYAVLMAIIFLILNALLKTGFPWQAILTAIAISIFYPLFFYWLPGKRFAVKGISLAVLFSSFAVYLFIRNGVSPYLAGFYITFIFGTSIFLALSYTGNSAVSNYSKVKQEIISFLPLTVVFYIAAMVFYFINGSIK